MSDSGFQNSRLKQFNGHVRKIVCCPEGPHRCNFVFQSSLWNFLPGSHVIMECHSKLSGSWSPESRGSDLKEISHLAAVEVY